MGAFETFLPLRMESCHWDPWIIGLIMASPIGAIFLWKPIMGIPSDKWQRKPLIVIGLLISSGSLLLLSSFQSNGLFVICAVGFGVGIAVTTASNGPLVSEFTQNYEYGSALGTLSSIMDVGHSAGSLLTGIFISSVGYMFAFGSLALFLAVTAIIFVISTIEP